MNAASFFRTLGLAGTAFAATGIVFAQGTLTSNVLLTATPSPLILPGTLTLTTTINQVPVAGGVPTGAVNFLYDGTHSLGSGTLKVLSSSQAFPATPSATLGTSEFTPAGLVSLPPASGGSPALVSLDESSQIVTLFYFSGPISTPAEYSYTIPTPPVDSIAGGFFLQPKTSGVQSFLIHGENGTNVNVGTYSVFDGSFNTATSALNPPKATSASGCGCGRPDSEQIAIDDFDGDGYSDVAALLAVETVGNTVVAALPGIVLNAGSGAPGTFSATFLQAPVPSTFCPTNIATGHFTSSAGAQLAVVGTTPASGNCLNFVSGDPSSIYLFALNAAKTQLVQVGTMPTDSLANSLTSGDLNLDGKTDLIIGDSSQGGVHIAFGNGDGTFAAESALISTDGGPLASGLRVSDVNGDGYPDLALVVSNPLNGQGSLSILLNDGSGNFKTVTQITSVNLETLNTNVPAAIDLNGDGLPDLTVFSGTTEEALNLSILVNSAAAQATIPSPPMSIPAGTHTITATYAGDARFAAGSSAAVTEQVNQTVPTLSWSTPASFTYGMTLNVPATAGVPGTFAYSPPLNALPLGMTALTATFMPTDTFDYASTSITEPINVTLPPVNVTVSAPSTTATGENPTVNLTLTSFPEAITVVATLSFTPAPPNSVGDAVPGSGTNTVGDATVVFANNTSTSDPVAVAANSPATVLPITFQSGSTAGTITVTTVLTDSRGVNVTPASLVPITITVPAAPPVLSAGSLTRSGNSLQIAVSGLSSTRDMTQAVFHFTPAAGQSLSSTDLTVDLTSAFQTWYQSAASDQYGTTFSYTQAFTISSDASAVQSVDVTLTNSQGTSQPTSVQ
jgi:FG-GAP-like repeat